jgi:hypothetical protein
MGVTSKCGRVAARTVAVHSPSMCGLMPSSARSTVGGHAIAAASAQPALWRSCGGARPAAAASFWFRSGAIRDSARRPVVSGPIASARLQLRSRARLVLSGKRGDIRLFVAREPDLGGFGNGRCFDGVRYCCGFNPSASNCRLYSVGAPRSRSMLMPQGRRPSTAARTRLGARKATDFLHLRRWRKSVEQAQSLTFKAVVGTIVSGLLDRCLARQRRPRRSPAPS